ncbi:MAG: phosphoenolpyruvate carboxylase [Actinomycetota bacterium]|nr:phosphoenolpyruvate carboxylase [Actinomycetota bacterium]
MLDIPRCMSTQHPDNATLPFFATSSVLAGEDEIREAFYAYSHLCCDEQMWDVEGKEIDTYVVKKLLSFYEEYFRKNVLGEDLRLTLRVPNPTVERTEAKVLLETLESIPRSYDAARLFYGRDVAPIFEVILPMTTSARCIDRIYHYYTDYIIERQHNHFRDDDISIAEWIGEFAPSTIQVIPLFEDVPSMLNAANIVEEYLADKPVTDQRVFLARSDTAMNYGLVSAALSNKIALAGLDELSVRSGVRLHPILGMGSAPFRGGLAPATAERVGNEYPSVVTFTIQSAFKFDHPIDQVRAACNHLRARTIGRAVPVDTQRALSVIERHSEAYRQRVTELAPQINRMAKYVPPRRARKLHIGLFGYAREMGGVTLPRAISFTCSLYNLGLPPELIAFDSLTDSDLAFVHETYPSFEAKIGEALCFTDFDSPLMTDSLRTSLNRAGFSYTPNTEHLDVVRRIRDALDRGETSHLSDLVSRAALIRRFLG